MPELPEVETIRRTLIHKGMVGKRIKKIHLPPSRLLRNHSSHSDHLLSRTKFLSAFTGETLVGLERWGKYLMIRGRRCSLILHLGMSGVIHWKDWRDSRDSQSFQENPHDRLPHNRLPHLYLRLSFTDATEMLFIDPRTFGRIILLDRPQPPANHPDNGLPLSEWELSLGPDALLTPNIKLARNCYQHTRKSRRPLKSALLDQNILAGVGNIYADESLFKSNLSPLREVNRLTLEEWQSLIRNLKMIFHKALKAGGSTLNDYRLPDGLEGNFQSRFMVYGKAEEPCPRCQKPLQKAVIQSRTTVFCSHCQR